MPAGFRNSFSARYRWATGLGVALAAVVLLVLIYRLSEPRISQTTAATGQRIPENEILKVGALPVT